MPVLPPIRVLVVDDSMVVRKVLSDILASIPGIDLAGTASSGEIALVKIPQLKPDVVTLDIEMPGMSGLQALAQIRKLYPKLPVIMFSTLTEHGAAATLEALALGATDYATKPTSGDGLAGARQQIQAELIAKITALRAPAIRLPLSAIPALPPGPSNGASTSSPSVPPPAAPTPWPRSSPCFPAIFLSPWSWCSTCPPCSLTCWPSIWTEKPSSLCARGAQAYCWNPATSGSLPATIT